MMNPHAQWQPERNTLIYKKYVTKMDALKTIALLFFDDENLS